MMFWLAKAPSLLLSAVTRRIEVKRTEEDMKRLSWLQAVRVTLAIGITAILTRLLGITFPEELLDLAAIAGVLTAGRALKRGSTFPRALVFHLAAFFLIWAGLDQWNSWSGDSDPRSDFRVALYLDDALLLLVWYTAAFLSTWLYWCRDWAATLEGGIAACLLIWLMSGHRNYHLDAPKQISSLTWKVPLLQRYHVEPQHLFLIFAAAATALLVFYLVLSAKRPLFRGDVTQRDRGVRRVLYATSVILLSVFALVGYTYYVNQKYAEDMSRATQGVGQMKEQKPGGSNLGFHSAMGATKQPAALVRLEGDYSQNPWAPMLYFREGALSHFNGIDYVLAEPKFDTDVPRIRPGQPFISVSEQSSDEFKQKLLVGAFSLLKPGVPFSIEYDENAYFIRSSSYDLLPEAFRADEAFIRLTPPLVDEFRQLFLDRLARLLDSDRPFTFQAYDGYHYLIGPGFDAETMEILPNLVFLRFSSPIAEAARKKITQSIFLITDHNAPFAIDYPERMGLIKNPNKNRYTVAYQAISDAPITKAEDVEDRDVGDPLWTKETWEHYLKAPGSRSLDRSDLPTDLESLNSTPVPDQYGEDLRYLAFARRLTDGIDHPLDKAAAIINYLSEKSVYTRQPGHQIAQGSDPVAPYLFAVKKRGYCVHFAHAAVFLLRLVGVPARIGTGYLTDLQYAKDGHILLSLADRHAWPEIYVDGYGWRVFDINPAEAENEQAPVPDEKLLEELMKNLDPLNEMGKEDPSVAVSEEEGESIFAKLLDQRILIVLVTALLTAFFAIKTWLRFGYLLVVSPEERVRRSYSMFASQMIDLGLGRDPGETRLEHTTRLKSGIQIESALLTRLLERTTYAGTGRETDPKAIASARDDYRASLRANIAWWKRVLAFFNPLSLSRIKRW